MGIVYFLGGKLYDFLDEHFEKSRYATIRKKLLSDIKGNILDAGCGTGRNFPYYSPKAKIVGIDNAPNMLKVARKRTTESAADIKVRRMNLSDINFDNNTFDAVVATFVLCVLPKRIEPQALKELVRVAKPGAKLYFLEYVYSSNRWRRVIMKLTAIVPKILYKIRYNTTLLLIEKENKLTIEKVEFVYEDVIRLIIAKKR